MSASGSKSQEPVGLIVANPGSQAPGEPKHLSASFCAITCKFLIDSYKRQCPITADPLLIKQGAVLVLDKIQTLM